MNSVSWLEAKKAWAGGNSGWALTGCDSGAALRCWKMSMSSGALWNQHSRRWELRWWSTTQPFPCCHGHEPSGTQSLNIRDCCCIMPSYPHLWHSSSFPVAKQRMVKMNSIRWVSRIVCFPSKEQHLLFLALLGIISVLNQTNSTLRLFEVLILHISGWSGFFGGVLFCLFLVG